MQVETLGEALVAGWRVHARCLGASTRAQPRHCGVIDKSGALKGKTDRIGYYKFYACRKKFTVKVGTIFEDSRVQMRDWLVAST